MAQLRIGVVATLSGPNDKLGRGVLRSAEFSAAAYRRRHPQSPIEPVVVPADDYGSVQGALQAVRQCIEDGCSAIIGPADSDSMYEVLHAFKTPEIPIVSTIATATDLVGADNSNFFRCTTPDVERCEILLNNLLRLHPVNALKIYARAGTPQSYGQAAKRDLLTVCKKLGIEADAHDFSSGKIEVELPAKKEPFVIAAPSSDGVRLLEHFRLRNRLGQAYSFGSSTNWLTPVARGTIVVCDLDRDDPNLRIRDDLDEFFALNSEEQDPSLTTKNAVYVLCSTSELLIQDAVAPLDHVPPGMLVETLRSGSIRGLFGQLSFSDRGEMLGYEQISLLRVVKRNGGMSFAPLQRNEKPVLYDRKRASRVLWGAFVFIGTLASIVGLAATFIFS